MNASVSSDLHGLHLPADAQGMVTIGITLDVPEPYGTQLREARRGFGDPRAEVVPAHITIIPPMDIPADAWPRVAHHIHEVACASSPFVIRLRGTGTFQPVSPVVFISLARGISDCEQLSGALRTGALKQPLTFAYHPHVAIAQELDEDTLEHAFTSMEDFDVTFMAHGFGVYVHQGDDEWQEIAHVPFGP